jgi:hypothetical protein
VPAKDQQAWSATKPIDQLHTLVAARHGDRQFDTANGTNACYRGKKELLKEFSVQDGSASIDKIEKMFWDEYAEDEDIRDK